MKTASNAIVVATAALTLILASSIRAPAATVTLNPEAVGFATNLSQVGGTANWNAVISDDGDTSYVLSTHSGYRLDLYNLTDVALTGIINSVTVCIQACSVGTNGTQDAARTGIRTGGGTFVGSNQTLTTSYTVYSTTYTTNPQSLVDWTWDEVNALEAGVSLRRSGTTGSGPDRQDIESRCTHVCVVVDYTPSELTCETAFAFGGDNATCFLEIEGLENSRWGWTNGPLAESSYTFDLYAAAGQCDLSKGTLVGAVSVVYAAGTATVEYIMEPGFTLAEAHLYVGTDILPTKDGKYTVAPGQYPYSGDGSEPFVISDLSGPIYVIAHAVVCGSFPAEE